MEASTLPENTGNPENGGGEEEERVGGEEGDRSFGGNRWPREETLALLKIRSDMDTAFRDTGLKAPLWEEVSRKLSELGYNRSAKKCKEKFENIYKYHRRTKEGRSGKTYRFFDQLKALDNHPFLPSPPPEKNSSSMAMAVNPINAIKYDTTCSIQNLGSNFVDSSTSTTSTSSKESEGTQKKKRKLTVFFERLMKEVIEKQESLQRKFIEAIEKCEQDRIAREEAWKMQELDRIKREHELLVQERSIAAAKDAAVLAFLQKFSEQSSTVQFPEIPIPVEKSMERQEHTGGERFMHMGSSRWPKDEVEALIKLRTNLDGHYQENGPKGPLWEEISSAMKKLGYDRSAKRCKEKWENMNKYFKKVKESNKKRPEDAKTCPYFHQLDAIYKEKTTTKKVDNSVNPPVHEYKPEELLMHMMGAQEDRQPLKSTMENAGSDNMDQNQDEDDDGDNEDEENEEDDYQLVAANPSSMAIMG